jgi:bacterioferritin-associated ferredoxin
MYICVCKGVTDTAIREAVSKGADRMRDLKTCLGVSGQCGRCACHAKEVLEKALMQKTMTQHHLHKPTRLYEISPEEA